MISYLGNTDSKDSLYDESDDSDESESTESSHSTSMSETESIGNAHNMFVLCWLHEHHTQNTGSRMHGVIILYYFSSSFLITTNCTSAID